MDKENMREIYEQARFYCKHFKYDFGISETDIICNANNIKYFAVITAHNPNSKKKHFILNWIANINLFIDLKLFGYKFFNCVGYDCFSKHKEHSYLIVDIDELSASHFMEKYNQTAIVFCKANDNISLIFQ